MSDNPPNFFVWNIVYQLEVISGPATVVGPTNSGGQNQTITFDASQAAYWNDFYHSFSGSFWSLGTP